MSEKKKESKIKLFSAAQALANAQALLERGSK
jgi:hypothetical protein